MSRELDAVNDMLSAINSPVVTNLNNQRPNTIQAVNKLERVSKRMQGKGYWFNKEFNYTLSPSLTGEVSLPPNYLNIKIRDSAYKHLVVRKGKLYDPYESTYKINAAVRANITVLLDLEDLPPSFWEYLSAVAVLEFFRDKDGDRSKLSDFQIAVQQAQVNFKRDQLTMDNPSNYNQRRVAQIMRYARSHPSTALADIKNKFRGD